MPRHDIHDTAPATRWEDAFLSGNGEYGIMVLGAPHAERVIFNHHRFVLPNGTRRLRAPAVADRLERVRDLILAGDPGAAQREFSDGRSLHWTQPFHPGFAMEIRTADSPPVAGYRRVCDFATGEVTVAWTSGTGGSVRRAFVSRADAVVVQELTASSVDVTIGLCVDLPGRPSDVDVQAAATTVDGQVLLTVSGIYPTGLGAHGFAGVTRVVTDGTLRVGVDTVEVRNARRVVLLTKLARYEDDNHPDDLAAAVVAVPADYPWLLARHIAIHEPMYRRVELDLALDPADADKPIGELLKAQRMNPSELEPVLLERMFHAGRYHLVSSSGVLPPRLTGVWLGAWGAAWSGDYTTDANVNLQLAAANLGALPEVVDSYARLLLSQVADWQANARAIYGARGILAPSRTDGESGHLFHLDDDWPWAMWVAGADWLLFPLYEHWQVTDDERFLVERLAPLLVQAALFFEDFLTRAGADGYVMFVPSYSPEIGPAGCDAVAAVNATMDLAAGRHVLGTAIEACEYLHTETDAVGRWRELLRRLPPYRVDERGALAEWAWPGLTSQENHRHVSHLYPVWPLHDITPDRTPDLATAAHRALRLRGDENLSAHGSLHRALVAARLKDADLAYRNLCKILGNDMIFRSLMTAHNPNLETYNADAAHALPAVLIEILVDSQPGLLELLPALSDRMPRGHIRGLASRAGVDVQELAWDLKTGSAHVVLRAPVNRQVTVLCRRADGDLRTGRSFELPATQPITIPIRLR